MIDAPRRILFIDDDAGLRTLIAREMTRRGIAPVLAADGAEGVRLAAEAGFSAICLDHHMPGQDGLETLGQLLALPDPPPVVYVTGSDDGRIAVAALRAGATDYIIKDASPDFMALLAARVEDAMEREALRRGKAEAEAAMRDALGRAEALAQSRALLLREVNHRVANSLQLISSLTRVQESTVADPAAREALGAMRNRIAAVAQVHRRLYTSDDVSTVALDDYLAGLLDEIDRSVGGDSIALTAEPVMVPTDHAVSLGVIVSELVTNALKYAYPEDRKGAIRVRLDAEADAGRIAVEDDGVGAAEAPIGTGLGRRIVEAMAASLGGAVEHASGPAGTAVTVRFALN